MHTYTRTWLAMGVLLVSLMRAQSPWTQWGIYADSTGNGQSPIHGTLQCHKDTFWLVVDTTGMGVAGITGWRWRSIGGTPTVVYAPSLSSVPVPFPMAGLTDRKVGIKPASFSQTIEIVLVAYFSNGDSAGFVRSLEIKGGSMWASYIPMVVCAGTSVSFGLNIVGHIDSFKVIYGSGPSDYVSNQANFTLTAPNSPGTWNILLRTYFCGDSTTSSFNIQVVSSVNSLPLSLTASSNRICPGDSVVLNVASPSQLAGITSLNNIQIKDPSGNTVQTATSFPVKWIAPNNAPPGNYNVDVTGSYSCGSYTQTYYNVFSVRGPNSLNAPSIFAPSNYCPGVPVWFSLGGAEGLVSVDIGADGSWDYVGVGSFFQHIFPNTTTFPVQIKVRQDVGCDSREDILTWNPTNTNDPPQNPSVSNGAWCPGGTVRIYASASNFTSGASGNYIQWNASWLSGPFYGVSSDTVIPAPSAPGSYTISATLYNNCGSTAITRPLSNNFFHPDPIPIGGVCASTGGSIPIAFQFIPPLPADSVQYYLPDGSIVTKQVTDTFVYNVPPNTAAASLIAKIMYGGCHVQYSSVSIPIIGNVPAKLMGLWNFGTTCAGAPFSTSMTVFNAQEVRIYLGSNLIASWIPAASSVFGTLVAPSSAGTYTYTIVAVGCGGNDTAQATLVVSGTGAVADFSAPGSACVGIPVTFQRNGTNNGIASASWYFGDGSNLTDTSMSVSHTYASPGIYTVFLSVTGTCGNSSMQKTIKVYGNAPSLSGLNITQSGNTITGTVNATDADSVKWFFDAPNTTPSASGTSVSHTYATTGTYTVMVVAYNPCGTDTLRQNVTIGNTSALLSSRSGEWTLYPNPARSEVFLVNPAYTGAAQVRIFDVQGRLVETHAVQSFPARLSLHLPTGLYQVQLITARGVETLRLAVE